MNKISILILTCIFSLSIYAPTAYAHKKVTVIEAEEENEWGVGTDVILHEGADGEILNKVTGEYKFDMNNNEHKGYLVATTKLADIWDKVKGLFNRE